MYQLLQASVICNSVHIHVLVVSILFWQMKLSVKLSILAMVVGVLQAAPPDQPRLHPHPKGWLHFYYLAMWALGSGTVTERVGSHGAMVTEAEQSPWISLGYPELWHSLAFLIYQHYIWTIYPFPSPLTLTAKEKYYSPTANFTGIVNSTLQDFLSTVDDPFFFNHRLTLVVGEPGATFEWVKRLSIIFW